MDNGLKVKLAERGLSVLSPIFSTFILEALLLNSFLLRKGSLRFINGLSVLTWAIQTSHDSFPELLVARAVATQEMDAAIIYSCSSNQGHACAREMSACCDHTCNLLVPCRDVFLHVLEFMQATVKESAKVGQDAKRRSPGGRPNVGGRLYFLQRQPQSSSFEAFTDWGSLQKEVGKEGSRGNRQPPLLFYLDIDKV